MTPWTAALQAPLSITNSQSLLKIMSIESVMPSNHLILCHPLLLLPSVFPSIRVFSSELVLCIRWPKYWSFSFSISPFNEYSGLLSFSIDRLFSIGLLFQTRWPWSLCVHYFVCSGNKKRPLKETLYIWQEEGELDEGLKSGIATQQHLREDKPGPAFLTSNLDQKAAWVGLVPPKE